MRRVLSPALIPTVQKCRYSPYGCGSNPCRGLYPTCRCVFADPSARYSSIAQQPSHAHVGGEKQGERLVEKEVVKIRRFARVRPDLYAALQQTSGRPRRVGSVRGGQPTSTEKAELLILARRLFRPYSDPAATLGEGTDPSFVEDEDMVDRSASEGSAGQEESLIPSTPADVESLSDPSLNGSLSQSDSTTPSASLVSSLLQGFSQMRGSVPKSLFLPAAIIDHRRARLNQPGPGRPPVNGVHRAVGVVDNSIQSDTVRPVTAPASPSRLPVTIDPAPLIPSTASLSSSPDSVESEEVTQRLSRPKSGEYLPDLGKREAAIYSPVALRKLRYSLDSGSPEKAWLAFSYVAASHPMGGSLLRPTTLHRMASVLVEVRPRTRTGFLRLLAVVNDIRRSGTTTVTTAEWNALMDFSGKGFRATTIEDFQAALGMYEDMIRYKLDRKGFEKGTKPSPDIVTYNVLLSVAARTRSNNAIAKATSLLYASPGASEDLPYPDNITFQSLMPYYTRMGTPQRSIEILKTLIKNKMPLWIDALNAAMWGYARNGKKDVAMTVYKALREHTLHPDQDWKAAVLDWQENPILSLAGLEFEHSMACDAITYLMLLQQHCYDGDLFPALRIFREMLEPPASFPVSMIAFRALFRGFARHAGSAEYLYAPSSLGVRLMTRRGAAHFLRKSLGDRVGRSLGMIKQGDVKRAERARIWDLHVLEQIFDAFIDLPWETSPNHNSIFTLLQGYARASEDDWDLLWQVWCRVKDKFEKSQGWSVSTRLQRVLERIKLGQEEAKMKSTAPPSQTELEFVE